MSDEQLEKLEAELKPRLTPEFLAVLVEAYKVFGNSGDSVATRQFVAWTYELAGVNPPSAMEVYDVS